MSGIDWGWIIAYVLGVVMGLVCGYCLACELRREAEADERAKKVRR